MVNTLKEIEDLKLSLEKVLDALHNEKNLHLESKNLFTHTQKAYGHLMKVYPQLQEELKNSARYQCLGSALFMSDGRPTISHTQYDNGKRTHSINLTGEECNKIIDPLIFK